MPNSAKIRLTPIEKKVTCRTNQMRPITKLVSAKISASQGSGWMSIRNGLRKGVGLPTALSAIDVACIERHSLQAYRASAPGAMVRLSAVMMDARRARDHAVGWRFHGRVIPTADILRRPARNSMSAADAASPGLRRQCCAAVTLRGRLAARALRDSC